MYLLPDLTQTSLEKRALFGLFILTGLLPSFPVVNQIDAWLLSSLHKAAFIPDDSRYLARKLYNSPFSPAQHVFSTVRDNLSMRDTARVASGKACGSLEKRIIDLLCLRAQARSSMESERFRAFKIHLERDFTEIANRTRDLRADAIAYLQSQARLIPDDVDDIDAYIANHQDEASFADLSKRRQALQLKFDTVYETMCLIIALSICATTFTPEEVDQTIKGLGFSTHVDPLPVFDLETVVAVTGLSFVLWLVFLGLFAAVASVLGIGTSNHKLFADRTLVLRFAILLTVAYGIVMTLAIKIKRKWRAERPHDQRTEGIRIALYSYLATVPVNMLVSYLINGTFLIATPYLYAVNQAVFGYFVAKYIDRSLVGQKGSALLALSQGATQGAVAAIAAIFAGSNAAQTAGLADSLFVPGFGFVQWTLSGFLVGFLFQRIYNRAAKSEFVTSSAAIPEQIPERAAQIA